MIRSQSYTESKGGYPDKQKPASVKVKSEMSNAKNGGQVDGKSALFKSFGKGLAIPQPEGHAWSHTQLPKSRVYSPQGEFGKVASKTSGGTPYMPTYDRNGKNAVGNNSNRKGQNALRGPDGGRGSNAIGNPPNRKGPNAIGSPQNKRGDSGLATALKGGSGRFRGNP